MVSTDTQIHSADQQVMAMRPFSASLPMALLRSREATMNLFRPLLADYGLTEQQWRVLRALTTTDHGLEVGEIAAQTNLLGPSLTRILANLGERGLVARQPVPGDARRALISLTVAGTALSAQVAPHSERTYNRIEAAFGADRLAQLLADLEDLRAHAEEL